MKMTSDFWTPSAVFAVKDRRPAAVFLSHQLVQTRLIDRNAARLEQFYLGLIIVHAHDVMTDFGKTGTGDQADIAGANERQIHGLVLRVNGAGDFGFN